MMILGALVLMLTNGCSAVFYAHDGAFAWGVTAAHCVKEGDVVNAEHEGRRFGCRVVEVDRSRDIAILKCDQAHVGEVACPVVPIERGSEVALVGYPGGVLAQQVGVLSDATIVTKGHKKQVVATSPSVVPGFSGGGVFTEAGLCGVVTHCTNAGGACSILDRVLDRGVDRAAARGTAAVEETLSPSLRDLFVLFLGWLSRFYFPGANMTKLVPTMTPVSKS